MSETGRSERLADRSVLSRRVVGIGAKFSPLRLAPGSPRRPGKALLKSQLATVRDSISQQGLDCSGMTVKGFGTLAESGDSTAVQICGSPEPRSSSSEAFA